MVQVPLKDYVYANARVRAMTSRLLDKGTFDSLLAAEDFGRAVNILDDTEYGPDIEVTILEGFRPTSIDRALNLNLARNFSKIKEFFIGRPRELLDVLLSRWDLYNLKTVIRGKRAMVPKSEITRNLMPVGSLDLVVLELIIDQPDLRAALDAMVMFSSQWWINYGEAIAPHMAEFLREKDLSIIELALAKFHYEQVIETAGGVGKNSELVRRVVGMEVDAINITTLLRICGLEMEEGRTAADYFIPGGILEEEEFAGLLGLGRMELVAEDLMSGTPYREPLQRAMELFDKRGETAFQDEMERYIIRSCLAISEDTLGIGVIIKYMWRKYLEVANLRIIVRGKSIGLIESQIREELITID